MTTTTFKYTGTVRYYTPEGPVTQTIQDTFIFAGALDMEQAKDEALQLLRANFPHCTHHTIYEIVEENEGEPAHE